MEVVMDLPSTVSPVVAETPNTLETKETNE
jgi:hypothetical protein